MELFPNPTHDRVNLTFEASYEEIVTLEVYSMSGVLVKKLNIVSSIGENLNQLDFSDLTAGVYVVSLNGERAGYARKSLVIQ